MLLKIIANMNEAIEGLKSISLEATYSWRHFPGIKPFHWDPHFTLWSLITGLFTEISCTNNWKVINLGQPGPSSAASFLRFFFFFDVEHFFLKSLLNLLLYCFCFVLFLAKGIWYLNSPTRVWTHRPWLRRWSLNQWTTRKVAISYFLSTDWCISTCF